jgi:hypothetical protein
MIFIKENELLYGSYQPKYGTAYQESIAQFCVQQFGRKRQTKKRNQEEVVNDLNIQDLHNSLVDKRQFFQILIPFEYFPKSDVEQSNSQTVEST